MVPHIKHPLVMVLQILLLASCTAPTTNVPKENLPNPTHPAPIQDASESKTPDGATGYLNNTQTMDTSTPISKSTASFSDPDPETWVKVMPSVREYFYLRKKAIISGNVEILWKRYPEIKQGADDSQGINAEKNTISNFQTLKPFDGNIFPESYAKIKVKLSNGNAEVLVHGMELYLYRDEAGHFEDSGGEFKIILFLRNDGNQWTVYKTADVSGP